MPLNSWRKKVDELLQEYKHYMRQVEEETTMVAKLEKEITNIEEAQRICQDLAQQVQQQAHHKIASVVTKCLEAVFPEDPYEFKIIFEQKRGKTDARMVFSRGGHDLDPTSAAGGGCVDVAALALRLASLVLSRPRKRKILFLDEPFKGVSPEYRELIPELLETLSKEMGVQIIMTTNFLEFQTGRIVRIKK